MKKLVAMILVFVMILNVFALSAMAIESYQVKPAAPVKQIACLPVCALPALPVIIDALTKLAILLTMITIAVVPEKDITKELEKIQKRKPEKIVYRTGSGSNMNLTPRGYLENGKPKDIDGLSYTDVVPIYEGYTALSCEAVNATKVLTCYQDPKNARHWLIKATSTVKHREWMNSRDNADKKPHDYTKILQTISVRVKK